MDGFNQGILTEGGRLSTNDLLLKVACVVKYINNIFKGRCSTTVKGEKIN
jgi:hypothetical protein